MRVISFVNMKGGVAKTTLAVNVADCLVRRHGARVAIIDVDPQFNATQTLISGDAYVERLAAGGHTVVQVFDDLARPIASTVHGADLQQPQRIDDIELWPVSDGLFLLPGHLELYRLEMGGGQGREHRLRRFVEVLKGREMFDYVIIDTPPTPSAWMSSALIASDYYVVPVKPEPLSATGIDLLRTVVARVEENYALNIKCLGVVLTIAEPHTIVYRNTLEFLEGNQYWRDKRFTHALPKKTVVARIQGEQRLILDANDPQLSLALSSITNELLEKVGA